MEAVLLTSLLAFLTLLLVVVSIGIFVFRYSQPLNEREVIQLAKKRRQKQIRQYFSFDRGEFNVNADFKKRMNPDGQFHTTNQNLTVFPAIAAALLKHKKHEWILVAFEKNRTVNKFWINKGVDRTKVHLYLSAEQVVRFAKPERDASVLIFHNHPNTDPTRYDCTRPSEQDFRFANAYSQVLSRDGINLLEFVCERGRHYQYFQSFSDDFLRLSEFTFAICAHTGKSSLTNLALHLERIF